MSLSQWTISKSHASNITATLSASSPIEGSTSLFLDLVSGTQYAIVGLTNNANVVTGKCRTLVRLSKVDGAAVAGVCGLIQSSISVGSAAYWAVIGRSDATTIRIVRGLASDLRSTGTELGSFSLGTTLVVNTSYAIELKWQVDAGAATVLLTASFGLATDFSDLAEKGSATDTTYLSGVSAGLGVDILGSPGSIKFDQTEIFRV
jgi:hypothetical protein